MASIVDIINKVGVENVVCQTIHQSSPDVRMVRGGKELRISFSSAPYDPLAIAKGERVGFVVWFDRDKLPEASDG